MVSSRMVLSAWGLIRISTGLPIAYTATNTSTDISSNTTTAWALRCRMKFSIATSSVPAGPHRAEPARRMRTGAANDHPPHQPRVEPARRTLTGYACSHPGTFEHFTGFIDGNLPQRLHHLIGLLVIAAVIAIAQIVAQLPRVHLAQPLKIHHRALVLRLLHAGQAGVAEIFHPRSMRCDRVDGQNLAPGFGRIPPVVKLHAQAGMLRHRLQRHAGRRLVAAMTVDDEHALEAMRSQTVEHVPDHGHIGFEAQRNGAGKTHERRRKPEGQRR